MHIFYHPEHTRHDPALLHRPDMPQRKAYYAEVAERGELIHTAVVEAGLGSVSTPGDFGLEPIADVHRHEMLTLLQTAYDRFLLEAGAEPAIPNTFSVRHMLRRHSQTILGLLGQYCYDTSSPIFKDTWDAAYWSAQTALSAAALVTAVGEQTAYALCRPPGHHAATDMFGGFCYLNNAAIAANWMVQQGQRVAILDVDYHHGNGTQAIFYGRAEVLFCSLHADPFKEYPYYWGFADEYGRGAGKGYNFNFPLPPGTEEAAYLAALGQALTRIRAFVPDALVVSLGVDTAVGDPVGSFRLEQESYGRIGAQIAQLNLPAVVVQEGGYLLPTLGHNVVAFLQGLTQAAE